MSKQRIALLLKGMRTAIAKHSPEILTGIGVTGIFATAIFAGSDTIKAKEIIDKEKEKRKVEKLPVKETVKLTWKCYIRTAISGVTSAACIIGASKINHKRNAALAAAYSLSEMTLRDYKSKVIETVGEKKEQAIEDKVAQEKISRVPKDSNEVYFTNKGDTLCFDSVSGRYFKHDIEKLRKIENDLNKRLRDEMYISLNEFYYEIGLPSIKIGDDIGWNIDRGYIDFNLSAQLTDTDQPCVVIDYLVGPRWDFKSA